LASDVSVVIQAAAAAVSAGTALGLGWLTVHRDRETRAERERDRTHEQRRRIVDAVGALARVVFDRDSRESDFELARAEISAALALNPVDLPSCSALLDEGMPPPPYTFGQSEPFNRIESALAELRGYARRA
jgi:hypothetical protein